MPHICPLCKAVGATCGPKTTSLPVDARITGVRVVGNKLVPNVPAPPSDMTDEERAEYELLVMSRTSKSLRQRVAETRVQAMAEGTGAAPHTSLSYVDINDGNGTLIKLAPDVARQYVELNPGSKIVREGALPAAPEGEIIGATKARTGEMFDAQGRQIEDMQPMTTRTFRAEDRTRPEALQPAVGTTGAAHPGVMTGTGSMTSSAVADTGATATPSAGAASSAPRITRPGTATKPSGATSSDDGKGTSTSGSTPPDPDPKASS